MRWPAACSADAVGVAWLALVAAVAQAKPSEAYLTLYLLRAKQLSADDLAAHVWPWAAWGAFALAVPIGVAADAFGSRRVIVLGMLFRQATRALLLYTSSVPAMAAMQLTYAASAAADTVLLSYAFSLARTPAAFGVASGLVRCAYHAGNVLASLCGEWWVEAAGWVAAAQPASGYNASLAEAAEAEAVLRPLFWASWATAVAALLACACLPPPRRPPPASLAALFSRQRGADALRELKAVLLGSPRADKTRLGHSSLAPRSLAHGSLDASPENRSSAAEHLGPSRLGRSRLDAPSLDASSLGAPSLDAEASSLAASSPGAAPFSLLGPSACTFSQLGSPLPPGSAGYTTGDVAPREARRRLSPLEAQAEQSTEQGDTRRYRRGLSVTGYPQTFCWLSFGLGGGTNSCRVGWCAWWVVGVAGSTLTRSYYQLQLASVAPDAAFGYAGTRLVRKPHPSKHATAAHA